MAVATKQSAPPASIWSGPEGVDETAWAAQIWHEKERISAEIDRIRITAYTIAGYRWERPKGLKRFHYWWHNHLTVPLFHAKPWNMDEDPDPPSPLTGKLPVPTDPNDLVPWTQTIVKDSRPLQDATMKIAPADARAVVGIAHRVGQLLGAVEIMMVAYLRLLQPKPERGAPGSPEPPAGAASPSVTGTLPEPSPRPNPPPSPPLTAKPPGADRATRIEILCQAMTEVESANDQLLAAKGHVANLISHYGSLELNGLMTAFAGLFVLYFLFHPVWGPWHVSSGLRPTYEILFWSMFGAIAMSALLIAQETMKGRFVPSLMFKYVYRIPLAPLVAYTLLIFFGVAGDAISGVATTISLDPTTTNYLLLILLSFLFGFFSKRSLEILDGVWKAMMSSAPDGGGAASEGPETTTVEQETAKPASESATPKPPPTTTPEP